MVKKHCGNQSDAFQSRLHEEYVAYPDLSSRATGHALNHALQVSV